MYFNAYEPGTPSRAMFAYNTINSTTQKISNAADLIRETVVNATAHVQDPVLLEELRRHAARRVIELGKPAALKSDDDSTLSSTLGFGAKPWMQARFRASVTLISSETVWLHGADAG